MENDTSATNDGPRVYYVSVRHGSDFPKHFHEDTNAFIYITKGSGRVMFDEELFEVRPGDCLLIRHHQAHEIFADDLLEYIAIVHPSIVNPAKLDFIYV
jgi:mannose-6-phosphate isomerase-like protein (cupin superfamily)